MEGNPLTRRWRTVQFIWLILLMVLWNTLGKTIVALCCFLSFLLPPWTVNPAWELRQVEEVNYQKNMLNDLRNVSHYAFVQQEAMWLCEGHFSSEYVCSLRIITFVMCSIGLLQIKCQEDNNVEWIITQVKYKKEFWYWTECVKGGNGGIIIF